MIEFDVIGITPFARPDTGLVRGLCRAGALGVLDLGCDADRARAALAGLARRNPNRGLGVLVRRGLPLEPSELPECVTVVVLEAGREIEPWRRRPVLVQVTSIHEAYAAAASGASGLIAKGIEAGGRVGEQTTFVLLQEIVGALRLPVWAQGGIGIHTAPACIAGGARGVVLDSQLALVRESRLPEAVRQAIGSMDGSETTLVAGHRVFSRPDLDLPARGDLEPGEVARLLGADDLRRQLLPAGQDAAFARNLATRFRTAGGVVAAIRKAIDRSVKAAQSTEPLAPHSPLAELHGTRYPIVQGPMTRVSDRAAFAEAVAAAGGLPFLALSMLPAGAARELLRETKERLGRRAWGVGILGFVPEELQIGRAHV